MEMANQMLAEIKAAKRRTNDGSTPKLQKAERPTSGGSTASLGERTDSLPSALSQMSLQGGPQPQLQTQPQYPQQYSPSSVHMQPPGQQQMQYPQSRPPPPQQMMPANYNMSQPMSQGMAQGYGYPNMPPPHMRQPMNPPAMQQPMNTPPMQRVPSPARPQSYAPVPNTAMMPRPYPGSPSPYQTAPSPQMGQQIQQRPHPAAPRVSSYAKISYRVLCASVALMTLTDNGLDFIATTKTRNVTNASWPQSYVGRLQLFSGSW
jgi:classical protein kinase C